MLARWLRGDMHCINAHELVSVGFGFLCRTSVIYVSSILSYDNLFLCHVFMDKQKT